MAISRFKFTLTGRTPLLLHADSIEWADMMTAWKNNPKNASQSVAGDDRTPAWRWLGSLYNDGVRLVLPSDNIATCILKAGAMMPTGKKQGTYKKEVCMMAIEEPYCTLLVNSREIAWSSIEPMMRIDDFAKHRETALALGIRLHMKRASVGQSKHIRVRPMIERWSVSGHFGIWDDKLAKAIGGILALGGVRVGLCDWRPGAPKAPGPYGTFNAEVQEVRDAA